MKTGLFLSYHFNQVIWSSLDWLFPPVCGGCNRPGSRWCQACREEVQVIKTPICEICGLPLKKEGVCSSCLRSRPHFNLARSWVIYEGPIRHALHTLKYRRNISLGETLAKAMSGYLKNMDWDIDIILPVPLGMRRLLERGYNQVALVAMPLAAILDLEFSTRSLERISETRSQVGLSATERKLNVEGAFRAKSDGIRGKNVLLMDDVATTGATLSACASALFKAGARNVFGFTIARVLPQHGLMMI